ncbi:MAG: DUF58 domain-containing protein [Anaerolinea sp.]|nr:DUF58 domain-containing protein [Anaerolinea sp.]
MQAKQFLTGMLSPTPITRIELRAKLLLLWLLLLVATAVLLPDRAWNTLLVGFGGMFLIAYMWVRLLAAGLHATRQLRFGWVAVGDRLEEQFTIHNSSPVPALWVEIIDQSNVPGYQANVVRSVGSLQHELWRPQAICSQRGQFHLGPWVMRSSDPFGVFTLTHTYAASAEIIIHPPIHGQLPMPLPAGESSGHTRARQRAWRATVNAATVRHYRPNDPYRWVHWPTSARRGELYVREFDLDAAGDIWLLIDMTAAAQLGAGSSGTEEHIVLLAASLAARGISQNRPIGLVGYGETPQIVPPGRGEGHRWRILRALALVQANGRITLARALQDLGSRARRGSATVIITPDNTAVWLPQLLSLTHQGLQSNVILLDRPSFGGEGNSAGLRDAIHHLGINCHTVRQGEVGQPLLEQERHGFWEFKVTGTGKVVTVRSPLGER